MPVPPVYETTLLKFLEATVIASYHQQHHATVTSWCKTQATKPWFYGFGFNLRLLGSESVTRDLK